MVAIYAVCKVSFEDRGKVDNRLHLSAVSKMKLDKIMRFRNCHRVQAIDHTGKIPY